MGAGEDEDADVLVAKYRNELADLKINSKPLINLLTMMAEDYSSIAPRIVQTIEEHLETVDADIKLPVLYLLDCILKNLGKDYQVLIVKNIVSSFCGVFEKVDDEKTRALLYKLRMTWKNYIPGKKLYAIDVRCRQMDPDWPIMGPLPFSNEQLLKALKRKFPGHVITHPGQVTPLTSTSPELSSNDLCRISDEQDVETRKELLEKQKQVLQLQMKKVEQELLQAELQGKTGIHREGLAGQKQEVKDQQQSSEKMSKEELGKGNSPSEMPVETHNSPRKRVKAQSVSSCPGGSKEVSSVLSSSKEPVITTTATEESSVYQFDPEFEAWLMDVMFPFPAQ